jgi:hypothetical protein
MPSTTDKISLSVVRVTSNCKGVHWTPWRSNKKLRVSQLCLGQHISNNTVTCTFDCPRL